MDLSPIAREQLVADLHNLGLQPAQDLLIHCSMRRIGPVEGGAATLLAALQEVAGAAATLVVPVQTTLNSLTSRAFRAATAGLSPAERAGYIAAMPGFDPASTPSTGMGMLAEHLRTRPGATRSGHPQSSFAALGPAARACMAVHDLDCHLGERSPLGWLYAADAAILLLGVDFTACTALHLAEYRLPGTRPLLRFHCFIGTGAERVAAEFTATELDDSDFGLLGAELEDRAGLVRRGTVGTATCRLAPLRGTVDFAVGWLADRRGRRSL